MTNNGQVSRKYVMKRFCAILEAVNQNPGINARQICEKVGFAAAPYLQDMEELNILRKEVGKIPSGQTCHHYYNNKSI